MTLSRQSIPLQLKSFVQHSTSQTMRTKKLLSAALAGLLVHASAPQVIAAEPPEEQRPLVQIAILLDTSGSMQGLIEQAKGQLWKIVNEFIVARQNGKLPEVHVALFEYGKTSLPAAEGFIRMIQPLTNDLDKISEELFALTTNGGDEYCGWVIREAVNRLQWSDSPDVYRAIFIAGNEPFTQGPIQYAESCKAAIEKGIVVNTIHCGDDATGVGSGWRDGAVLADGKYMFIDQNRAVVHFEAPQDAEIVRLSNELNKTYAAYGQLGAQNFVRQAAQDQNAFLLASQGAAVNRALTKASVNYCNSSWDLVDAVCTGTVKLEDLKPEDRPEEMRKMTLDECKVFLEGKSKERAEMQAKINALNEERNKYVAEQMKAHSATNTLDAVIVSAVREQAAKRNFQFE
jgi:hypothetical protein